MVRVVGVRFKKAGKVYYFDPAEYPIVVGAKVVVETARGIEYGEVAVGPKDVADDQVVQPLKRVLRPGSEKDAIIAAENKRREKEAFSIAQRKIEAHSLEMTLVDVEYTFDSSKIIFYFTAEGRIDFRELVRDLAGVFRTRIEMRQIGVRDEAKLLGGIGPCGRILCCTSFLGDFAPVSIRMAKDQNLSLNPSKISGLCGRLMCCLRYEQETYEAAKKDPTLAPGYVPPAVAEAVEGLGDLDEQPMPAIGIRNPQGSGMSARIARAAGLGEQHQPREERPVVKRGNGERPQGGAWSQGQGQPQSQRPQGGPRKDGESRQQSPERRVPPAKPPQGQARVAGGERQQPKQQGRPPQGQAPASKGNQTAPQGQRPPVDPQREERPAGSKEPGRPRHHRRRRSGDRPQGGERPPGGDRP